jgi:poly-gamma-glutamate capsule biosynthesis protein CapA/YwtB (metallophosphatase superfamily)
VRIAEEANGPIPRAAAPGYVWGDALGELERAAPAARIVNLETAVTTSGEWRPKGINYRMNPANVDCLAAARVDCCVLANNHVLDWGEAGLAETLSTLRKAGFATAGAGLNAEEAEKPAVLKLQRARLLVFSYAMSSSGVPRSWAARAGRPGVAFLEDLGDGTLARIGQAIGAERRPGDIVVVSVHWGANWGYEISPAERHFAQALVSSAGADVFHGHSSHHPKGIEVHQGKLILYGCGDLINDYEGIGGREEYRGDLGLMYFPRLAQRTGRLESLEMVATRMQRFSLRRAPADDAGWLAERLSREGRALGTSAAVRADGRLALVF